MARAGTEAVYEGKANGAAKALGNVPERSCNNCYYHFLDYRKLEKIAMIKWYHWLLMLTGSTMMFLGVVALLWLGVYRGEVASYGSPLKTYFKPARGVEGQEIQLCFDDVVWRQICPSTLVTYITPAKGPRLDLQSYRTNPPPVPGRVPPKCRAWKVPFLGDGREPGEAVVSGHLRSECTPLDHWYPIYTPFPSVKFNWLRAN